MVIAIAALLLVGQAEQDGQWAAAGHADGTDWLDVLGDVSALLLLGLFVFLVARAIARRGRYRAVTVFDEAARARIAAELAESERRTVGEVVPVVLERSDAHPQAGWLAGVATLVIGMGLLAGVLPWNEPLRLLAAQAALFLVGFLCAWILPDFRRLFVSERRATEMAEEQALQEFYRLGLDRTEARTGVLIFVSLFERRAIVLADAGIDALVPAEHWEHVDDAILAGIRAGDLPRGLSDGLRLVADVLAERFPWTAGDRDEVPNRVIVRRE